MYSCTTKYPACARVPHFMRVCTCARYGPSRPEPPRARASPDLGRTRVAVGVPARGRGVGDGGRAGEVVLAVALGRLRAVLRMPPLEGHLLLVVVAPRPSHGWRPRSPVLARSRTTTACARKRRQPRPRIERHRTPRDATRSPRETTNT